MTAPPSDTVAAERLVLKLARALHEAGAPAHRLEDVMALLAPRLGIEGQFFSTPTSIFASFGPEGAQRTALVRVEPGGVNLERLALLDALIARLHRGTCDIASAEARVAEIAHTPPLYPAIVKVGCVALASATAARFFGGGVPEIVVAAAIGLSSGALIAGAARRRALARVFEPLASVTASLIALGFGAVLGAFSLPLATLAGLIVLLPGLSLTLAMTEIATRHLVAGTARLAGAGMTFLGLGLGMVLGIQVGRAWKPELLGAPAESLPLWTLAVSLALSPIALTVLFGARAADFPAIAAVGTLGFLTARAGAENLGPEFGMFGAALAVGVASNAYARLRRRPAAIPLLPGILMLVPGSLGLKSIASLFERDVLSGIDLAFRLTMLAVALTGGLLFSNLALPPRRSL